MTSSALRRLDRLARVWLCLAAGRGPEAQQPSAPIRPADQPVFRLSVSLVQLDAVVTDKHGRHVTTLGPRRLRGATRTAGPSRSSPCRYVQADDHWVDTSGLPPLPVEALKPEDARRVIVVVVDDLRMSFEQHLPRPARHRRVLRARVPVRRHGDDRHHQRRRHQPAHLQPRASRPPAAGSASPSGSPGPGPGALDGVNGFLSPRATSSTARSPRAPSGASSTRLTRSGNCPAASRSCWCRKGSQSSVSEQRQRVHPRDAAAAGGPVEPRRRRHLRGGSSRPRHDGPDGGRSTPRGRRRAGRGALRRAARHAGRPALRRRRRPAALPS